MQQNVTFSEQTEHLLKFPTSCQHVLLSCPYLDIHHER